jgi:hypothetical protein
LKINSWDELLAPKEKKAPKESVYGKERYQNVQTEKVVQRFQWERNVNVKLNIICHRIEYVLS